MGVPDKYDIAVVGGGIGMWQNNITIDPNAQLCVEEI